MAIELPQLMKAMTDTPLVPVTSSNVAAVGYHPETGTLFVQYQSGGTYAYHDVPADKHAAMLEPGGSVGKLLHSTIKPYHAYTRVV